MNILGKIIGTVLGFMVGGLYGAIMGFLLGMLIDAKILQRPKRPSAKEVFFRTTFLIMGKLAKADGVVSENEIELAEKWIKRLQLTGESRTQAIKYFNLGKNSQFDLDGRLQELKNVYGQTSELLQTFVDIQWQLVLADGQLNINEKNLLQHICSQLNINPEFIFKYTAQKKPEDTPPVTSPYQVLNVTEEISDAELTKTYRRLMNQYHPDKLISKGLPEEFMVFANRKTQEIRAAYDQIRKSRQAIS